ncbi:MAG: outer membrane beta-barrel protein [Candidatus Aminicenantales bacterium]
MGRGKIGPLMLTQPSQQKTKFLSLKIKKILIMIQIIGLFCGNCFVLLHAEGKRHQTVIKEFNKSQQEIENFLGKTKLSVDHQEKSTARKLWRFSLIGIYGFPNMTDMNDYIQSLNTGFNGDIKKIKIGIGSSFSLIYQFNTLIGAGLSYEYLRASSKGTLTMYQQPLPTTYSHELTISTNGILGIVAISIPLAINNVDINGIVGPGIYFSKYNETRFNERDNGVSFGFKAGIGFNYLLTSNFGISGEACYRMITVKEPVGVPEVFPGIYRIANAQADLNGFALSLGILVALK